MSAVPVAVKKQAEQTKQAFIKAVMAQTTKEVALQAKKAKKPAAKKPVAKKPAAKKPAPKKGGKKPAAKKH